MKNICGKTNVEDDDDID